MQKVLNTLVFFVCLYVVQGKPLLPSMRFEPTRGNGRFNDEVFPHGIPTRYKLNNWLVLNNLMKEANDDRVSDKAGGLNINELLHEKSLKKFNDDGAIGRGMYFADMGFRPTRGNRRFNDEVFPHGIPTRYKLNNLLVLNNLMKKANDDSVPGQAAS